MEPPFQAALDALVADVDRGWAALGRDPAGLSEVASGALERSEMRHQLTIRALCGHVARAARLATQLDPASAFGEPPVTLALAEGFHVDAYLWVQPTTVIHDHGFTGAFQVVEGVSMHTVGEFESDAPGDAPVRLGQLTLRPPELLRSGAVRRIEAGARFIHQVAHLSSPSLSLVVRTTSALQVPTTYEYLPAGVAMATTYHLDHQHRRKLEIAGWVLRMGRDHALEDLRALMASGDPLLVAWMLRTVTRQCFRPDLGRLLADESDLAFAWPLVEALDHGAGGGSHAQLAFVDDAPSRMAWVAAQNGFDAETLARLRAELSA